MLVWGRCDASAAQTRRARNKKGVRDEAKKKEPKGKQKKKNGKKKNQGVQRGTSRLRWKGGQDDGGRRKAALSGRQSDGATSAG